MRVKKPAPQPSATPWRCVVLTIDPGERSGWSIWREGVLEAHGFAQHHFDRQAAVARAFGLASSHGLPLVVVGESWSARRFQAAGGRLSTAALVGLGASWGRWLEQLDREPGQTLGRWHGPAIVRVEPPVWRAVTIGNAGNSAACKLRAVNRATVLAREAGLEPPTWSDDADAIVMGEWACRAGQVGAVLPAAFRGAA